jgi:hypothetical protein
MVSARINQRRAKFCGPERLSHVITVIHLTALDLSHVQVTLYRKTPLTVSLHFNLYTDVFRIVRGCIRCCRARNRARRVHCRCVSTP